MLAPIVHLLPLTVIRRERKLPFPGKILVRKGQKVGANDPVVEARLNPKHLMIDVAASLGIARAHAERYVRVKVGERLSKGDLIAGPVGFGRRVVRAPQNGQVILVGEDQILLELTESPFQVKAGMAGEVVELIGDCGVVIETTGVLIQGNWGNGRIDFGLLTSLVRDPRERFLPDQMDLSMRGSMILGGHCESESSLYFAHELPVRGLILASMLLSLRQVAEKMDFPILLLEGFGDYEMNKLTYKLLSNHNGREISVNAQHWEAFEGRRPEIVIPLPGDDTLAPPRSSEIFAVNHQVRSVREPYAGRMGRLNRLCGTVKLPSGIRAQAAEVHYDNGEKAILPLDNLELIA